MHRVLFVDDEPKILTALARSLRRLKDVCHMEFAEGAAAALEACRLDSFDVVVSDARMPGMTGPELLAELRRSYPDTVRIILSGQCDRESVLRCVHVAHQFLSKPCDIECVAAAIRRMCAMRDHFRADPARCDLTSTQWLPSRIAIRQDLCALLSCQDATPAAVNELVRQDVALSAKLVQLVSTGFFGTPQHVRSPEQAAQLLGIETLKSLFAAPNLACPERQGLSEDTLCSISDRSRIVAALAEKVAASITGNAEAIGDAYLAGLFHAVGALGLNDYSPSPEMPDPGAYLLAIGGLPDAVVQAVAHYRNPSRCGGPVAPPDGLYLMRVEY